MGAANLLATTLVYWAAKSLGLVVDPQSAGTGYAMLLISRYREELQRNDNRPAAMVRALRRSELDPGPRPGGRDRHRLDTFVVRSLLVPALMTDVMPTP